MTWWWLREMAGIVRGKRKRGGEECGLSKMCERIMRVINRVGSVGIEHKGEVGFW